MKKIIEFIKTHKLYIFLFIITIIKIIYISDLPVVGRENRPYDEKLMTELATSLKNGEYLGEYNSKTLVKPYLYPLLMAIMSILHIPYLLGLSTLYALSCFIFTYTLKDYIKKTGYLGIIYALLLFNPASFGKDTFLVLYRNSLGIIYALLLLSTLIKLYQHKNNKKFYLYSIVIGLLVSFINLTRADPEWTIVPIVFILLLTIRHIKQLISIPIIIGIPCISVLIVSAINNHYYHVFTHNEIKSSAYTEAFQQLLAIKPVGKEYDKVSLNHETLKEAIKASKTLKTIEPQLEELYKEEHWGVKMKDGTLEIINAYTIWAIRDALDKTGGYESAEKANTFWKNVANELKQAFKENRLEKRNTTPFILLNTPSLNKTKEFITNTLSAIKFSNTYEKMYIILISTDENQEKVENLTHQKTITNKEINHTEGNGYETKLETLNNIKDFYAKTGLIAAIIALITYIIRTIITIIKKKKDPLIIISTCILLSYLANIISVSYTHTFSFETISAFYLNPVYALQIAFISIQLIYLLDIIIKKLKLDRRII